MPKVSNSDSSFKAGMYLLETLTSGMYNEPLSIYREYIQNSVDSIDMASSKNIKSLNVKIDLDPFNRKITIADNGFGLSSDTAETILCSIGSSNKINSNLRGFRGIGRLGGIAFSDKAIFQTKSDGENIESIQEWDCKKLRKYLSDPSKSKMSLSQLFKKITNFYQANSKKKNGSYFNVTLEGVSSFRNYIFDLKKVRSYLSQIAPVPFNSQEFSHSEIINNWLSKNLKNYGVYDILINDEPIYKPYHNSVKITKKGYDQVEDIKFFKIEVKDNVVACGWYGVRKDLLGAIAKGENSSGIRVRAGNILIGDSHLLDGCFREPRFNGYVVGEIHIDSPHLTPNSRRDDFVDNEYKTLFYNAVEREIGLGISKEIRMKSRLQSTASTSCADIKKTNKKYMPSKLNNNQTDTPMQLKAEGNNHEIDNILNTVFKTCYKCDKIEAISFSLKKLLNKK